MFYDYLNKKNAIITNYAVYLQTKSFSLWILKHV